jgi:hypothetical protein
MSISPDARWTSRKHFTKILGDQTGPATPRQRRIGNRVAIGLMLAALLTILLLDHYGVLH